MSPALHTNRQTPLFLLQASIIFILVRGVSGQTDCPWAKTGLEPWDSPDTWDDKTVPSAGAEVTIKSGHKVLLNVKVDLASLTIEKDAELIWANLSNIELRTQLVLVDGAFHIGSENCRLELPASIKLTGRSDSDDYLMLDNLKIRKCILVRDGGALEMHGKEKTPWTRLAQTAPSINDLPNAVVYDHNDKVTNVFANDVRYGMHVIVWNRDGSVMDFSVFQQYTTLKDFISTIPDGKVIGMYAYAKDGIGNRKSKKANAPALDDAIISELGGQLISDVNQGDAYSLLTVKGSPGFTQEFHKKDGRSKKMDINEYFLQHHILEEDLVFQVAKSAKTKDRYFRVLQAAAGMPILELADDVIGWKPGDRIVVASTDFDWTQAEIREIVDCNECSPSQIRVNESFRYRHYGNITFDVDERAELGLLTRNIVIEGVMEDECYPPKGKLCGRFGEDTYGAHLRFERGFKAIHVQGVELHHVGQQINKGAYPLHFHMADEAPGSWVKDCSIHKSFSRCVTVHGTDKVEVSGIVCYDHLGHGFFLEDSVEQENVIKGNLGIGTKYGTQLLSDSTKPWCKDDYKQADFSINCAEVSTFWLTHPNNFVLNNAAGGSECHGFMYVFADVPLGPSYDRQLELGKVGKYHAKSYPITQFYNNVAHSNKRSGVFIDSYISSGGRVERDDNVPENGIVQEQNEYEPKFPYGDFNGTRIWTKLERVTTYKNFQNNMWVKGGNINVTFSSMADPATQSFSGGCTGFWTGTSIEYSVLIGRTDNLGEPRLWNQDLENGKRLSKQFPGSIGKSPWSTLSGVSIYQGPMFVKHSYFDQFQTTYWEDSWTKILGKRPVSYAGAISFKKDSTYPTYTSQYTTNLTFGYCDNVNKSHFVFFGTCDVYDWKDTDGPKNAFNRDIDGSLTGTPNTVIVRDRDFFTGPECLSRPDWGMSVCPYRYIKVEFRGSTGSLSKDLHDEWPLVARRDDAHDDPFYQKAQQRMEYLTRTHKSYLVGLNTTLDGAKFPTEVKIYSHGAEKQDVVRIGLCVPRDMRKFEVVSDYPVPIAKTNFTRVYSLEELDADKDKNAVFHDIDNGIIFFKVWSLHDRTNDSQLCPAGKCYKLKLKFLDGDRSNVRDCFKVTIPPFKDVRPAPPKVQPKPCQGKGSPQGLGAVRWDEVKKIVHNDFSVPRVPLPVPQDEPGRTTPTYKGCFDVKTQSFRIPQMYPKVMTVDWCVLRCYQRRFTYAALTKGSTCSCGNDLDETAPKAKQPERKCAKPCKGSMKDKVKTCGTSRYAPVWTTGW